MYKPTTKSDKIQVTLDRTLLPPVDVKCDESDVVGV